MAVAQWFHVPLTEMDAFESFNQVLPGQMREASTWVSLELTMADGTEIMLQAPSKLTANDSYRSMFHYRLLDSEGSYGSLAASPVDFDIVRVGQMFLWW